MLYDFECYLEDGGCGHQFEVKSSMNEIVGLKPKCPACKGKKAVARNYGGVHVFDGQKTLGSLADKNSSKMSEDFKNYLTKKHTEYQREPFSGKLSEGMEVYQRDGDGKIIPRKQ